MSDLRKSIIRLAHKNPELRKDLLPLLKEARLPKHLQYEGEEVQGVINRTNRGAKLMWELESEAKAAKGKYPHFGKELGACASAAGKAESQLSSAAKNLEKARDKKLAEEPAPWDKSAARRKWKSLVQETIVWELDLGDGKKAHVEYVSGQGWFLRAPGQAPQKLKEKWLKNDKFTEDVILPHVGYLLSQMDF